MRFEDYLMEEFDKVKAEEYGYADISDSYDHWVEHLEINEWIELGQSYAIKEMNGIVEEQNQISIRKLIALKGGSDGE